MTQNGPPQKVFLRGSCCITKKLHKQNCKKNVYLAYYKWYDIIKEGNIMIIGKKAKAHHLYSQKTKISIKYAMNKIKESVIYPVFIDFR